MEWNEQKQCWRTLTAASNRCAQSQWNVHCQTGKIDVQLVQLPYRLTSHPASRMAGSEDGVVAANQGCHLEEWRYQSGLGWDPYPVRGDCMTWFGSGG